MARADREKSAALDGNRVTRLLSALGWKARDAVGFVLGACVAIAIVVNVLFLQSGSHPAPIFQGASARVKLTAVADGAPTAVPRPRRTEPAALPPPTKSTAPSAPRPPGEIIKDIQRELSRRGYYDGVIDGLYGPRTDAAIRDFEQAAALKPSTEPNEALLQSILRAPAKLVRATIRATVGARPAQTPSEAAGERPTASKRVIALQRALAEYGYGQIKPSGIIDAETQAAIEKFERERRLPITGQASDRLVRELAAMTGRPLE
jgi:peptidoglycan hydrolase-like protein with peptidoglycan-binding domain